MKTMQFSTKPIRNQINQARSNKQSKQLKNHDRVLYVRGLFTPPKFQENSINNTKETEEWRSLFTLILIAGFGAVMILISVVGSYGVLATNRLEARETMLLDSLTELESQKNIMQEEIIALRTNPQYIELTARKELGLVRKGELIYFLPKTINLEP